MGVINHGLLPFIHRVLPLLVFLGMTQPAMGQQTASISPSVVLVLKLVSNTHVKPTTGVVISDNGLVLVSADFALSEGELIVLDGGTDIVSHGRPAKLTEETVSGKLAVISVEGLTRPGITLSNNALKTDSELFLEAFPPAGNIAKGDQPLRVPVKVLPNAQGTGNSVSTETPLPYVSGAIIDHCGYLAGVSISSGPQSLGTDRSPLIMFTAELNRTLDAMQLTPAAANCAEPGPRVEVSSHSIDDTDSNIETAGLALQKPQSPNTEAIESPVPEPVATGINAIPSDDVVESPISQPAPVATGSLSVWREVPLWLALLIAFALGVLLWKATLLFRLHKSGSESEASRNLARDVQPASDEPVTAPLEIETDIETVKPRAAPVMNFEIPAFEDRPEGCDGVLLVEGFLDAETDFKRFCFVNSRQVNVIIGRGDADIVIEHAAISRSHVKIESDGDLMTVSDLGSRNGTFIGDVPCLPGEIMYFEADDILFLGDVKLTVRLVRQEAEWA